MSIRTVTFSTGGEEPSWIGTAREAVRTGDLGPEDAPPPIDVATLSEFPYWLYWYGDGRGTVIILVFDDDHPEGPDDALPGEETESSPTSEERDWLVWAWEQAGHRFGNLQPGPALLWDGMPARRFACRTGDWQPQLPDTTGQPCRQPKRR